MRHFPYIILVDKRFSGYHAVDTQAIYAGAIGKPAYAIHTGNLGLRIGIARIMMAAYPAPVEVFNCRGCYRDQYLLIVLGYGIGKILILWGFAGDIYCCFHVVFIFIQRWVIRQPPDDN